MLAKAKGLALNYMTGPEMTRAPDLSTIAVTLQHVQKQLFYLALERQLCYILEVVSLQTFRLRSVYDERTPK